MIEYVRIAYHDDDMMMIAIPEMLCIKNDKHYRGWNTHGVTRPVGIANDLG